LTCFLIVAEDIPTTWRDCVDLFVRRFGDGAGGGLVAQLRMLWRCHDLARQIQKLKVRAEDESRRRGSYRLLDDHAALGNQQPSASPVTMDPRISALYEDCDCPRGDRWLHPQDHRVAY
jgi:hypothetical protein